MWLAALAARNLRAKTIDLYLTALNSLHKDLGIPSRVRSDTQIMRAIIGIKKTFGVEPARPPRLPVTSKIIRAIEHIFNPTDPDHRMLRAAMWTACVWMMRPGEIAVENAKVPERMLTISSLTRTGSDPTRYSIRLAESKT